MWLPLAAAFLLQAPADPAAAEIRTGIKDRKIGVQVVREGARARVVSSRP